MYCPNTHLARKEPGMPLYRVTFMNHIVETYVVEAASAADAWNADPADYEEKEPDDWDCTSCEVIDVEFADQRDFQEEVSAN